MWLYLGFCCGRGCHDGHEGQNNEQLWHSLLGISFSQQTDASRMNADKKRQKHHMCLNWHFLFGQQDIRGVPFINLSSIILNYSKNSKHSRGMLFNGQMRVASKSTDRNQGLFTCSYFKVKRACEASKFQFTRALIMIITIRGLPLSTSAPRRGGSQKIGRFCRQTVLQKCGQGGKGVQKSKNFADVLNGSP